jgi:hypothetical protein
MSNRDRIAVLSEICPFDYKDSNILQKNDNLKARDCRFLTIVMPQKVAFLSVTLKN